MVVEMRTYSFHPGMTVPALARIAQGLDQRQTLSPLGALWISEIGRRSQIVHLWPYRDLAHREQVRSRFAELSSWPARTGEYTAEAETKVLRPAPFSPVLEPRECGPVFEICTDTYRADSLERILELWTPLAAERSNLVGAWHTVLGPMNQWIHIWAYASFEQRAKAPPVLHELGNEHFLKRESGVYFPASFSPIR